jgi:rhodanese-related sulfurtransferase
MKVGCASTLSGIALSLTLFSTDAPAQVDSIYKAALAEPDQKTSEVSTEQVRRILLDRSAIILDARTHAEYAAGHIPGVTNLDAPPSEQVAVVERLVNGDKSKALVLYCNGPFCQASKRLGDRLVAAGFTNVRRYQLGMPIWRALGGPTEIELEGILRIFQVDRTAVFFDTRAADEYAKGSLPGARNMPSDKVASDGLKGISLPKTTSIHELCCSDAIRFRRVR